MREIPLRGVLLIQVKDNQVAPNFGKISSAGHGGKLVGVVFILGEFIVPKLIAIGPG